MKQAGFFGGDSLRDIKDDLLKVELKMTEAARTCEGYKRDGLDTARAHIEIAERHIDTLFDKNTGCSGETVPGGRDLN